MQNLFSRFLVLVLLCVAARACAQPTQSTTLQNGLQVLLVPDSQATAVDIAVWYGAGTSFEKHGESGITHLLERLMLRGAGGIDLEDPMRQLMKEGAVVNTFTTPDFSSSFETVPIEAIDLALKLEAGRMQSLRLTEAELEAELKIARQERKSFLDSNPLGRGLEKLYSLSFDGHPYARPVLGLDSDLGRITLAQVEEYYRTRYAPNNALLTVVGRFEPASVLSSIGRYFEPLPRRPVANSKPVPFGTQGGKRATEFYPGSLPVLLVGWRVPNQGESIVFELLSRLLSGGGAGRLERAFVNQGVLQTRASFDSRKDASVLYCIATLRPGADTLAVEREMIEEVEKLARETVTDDELDRVKRELELGMRFDWQTVRGRARALGTAHWVHGDYRQALQRFERVRQITPADIQRLAATLTPARSVVWLLPVSAPLERSPGAKQGGE